MQRLGPLSIPPASRVIVNVVAIRDLKLAGPDAALDFELHQLPPAKFRLKLIVTEVLKSTHKNISLWLWMLQMITYI
jgi:hypothetical protein